MALKDLKYVFCHIHEYIKHTTRRYQEENKLQIMNARVCWNTILAFGQLSYISDLCSSDILRQVVQKLLLTFHGKWAEYCFNVKQTKEPIPVDFENCFHDRILALKEAYLPPQKVIRREEELRNFILYQPQ